MAKRCPVYGNIVLYLDCLECEDKRCRHGKNYFSGRSKNNGPSKGKENIKEKAMETKEED